MFKNILHKVGSASQFVKNSYFCMHIGFIRVWDNASNAPLKKPAGDDVDRFAMLVRETKSTSRND